MQRVVFLTIAAVIGGASSAYGQGSDLQQKLKDQFILTKVNTDGSDITTAGTVVTLRKVGFMAYSTASPVPYLNTYNEKGKIFQPFMANLREGVVAGLNSRNTNYPTRLFIAGEKFSIIGLFFPKEGITLRLYSDPYRGIHYYGDLTFPFKKGSVPVPEEVLARIAEVLAQSGTQPKGPDQTDTLDRQPRADPSLAVLHLPATYVSTQTPTDQLQLNADNSLSLQEGGQNYRGSFVINGNAVEINIADTNTKTTMTIQGTNLGDANGQTWTLRDQSAQTAFSEGAIRNEDIIKLAKVIDDATIIAKIGSSKCHFDTSTDALIRLKESGVSATVLKAMVGAGK